MERLTATSSLGAARPEAAAFPRALARLGVRPEEATYVGDRLDVDARGAEAAGLQGMWLDRAGTGSQVAGIGTVTSLSQLP